MGHIENDLCATLWFSYLLVFLEQVTKMDPGKAGILMVIGQLTDGIATPIVGLGLDKEAVDHVQRFPDVSFNISDFNTIERREQ